VNKDSVEYVDYPVLEPGAPGVVNAPLGSITRYWDDCKPSCTETRNLMLNNGTVSPIGHASVCDRNGNEMPLYYRQLPEQPTHAVFLTTPNAGYPDGKVLEWPQSTIYAEWKAQHPDWNFPSSTQSAGYLCAAEQIPYAVNDTLAYAFAASQGACGKCYMLQFRSDVWQSPNEKPRVTNVALSGKTLIIMVNNFGVGNSDSENPSAFDIMIPGGGLGACRATLGRLNVSEALLGRTMGGLLAECTFGNPDLSYSDIEGGLTPIERHPIEDVQECLRAKCHRTFGNQPPQYLKGCLWHADWFMAADNPEVYYKEVDCPKYLVDRYKSSFLLPTRPADLNPGVQCQIGGVRELDCLAP
jgi:hypothetical protein